MVVDGNGVGGQQTRSLVASEKLTLEVGLCPDAFVCLQLILKPFSIEVAVVGAVDPRHDDTVWHKARIPGLCWDNSLV